MVPPQSPRGFSALPRLLLSAPNQNRHATQAKYLSTRINSAVSTLRMHTTISSRRWQPGPHSGLISMA